MFKLYRTAIFCLGLLLLIHGAESVLAGGLTNSSIGLRGMAMSGTPVSNANDATAVYYNPAALALNAPNTWSAEVYSYMTQVDHKYKSSQMKDESDRTFLVPGSFLSRTKENWGWGVGMYVPFAGGGMKYEDYHGIPGFDMEMTAGYMAITTSGAYKINPKLSVGAGFTILTGQITVDTPTNEAEYEDSTAGFSGNVGLIYILSDESRIGLNFRLPTSVEMDGDVTSYVTQGVGTPRWMESDSTVEFTLPWILDVGYTHYFSENFMLSARFSYYAYGDMDEYTYVTGGREDKSITNYDDSWTLGIGGEYILNPKYTVRFGSSYASYARKKSGLQSPFDIDPNVLTLNSGLGYNLNRKVELAISYFYGLGFERENNNKKFDQDNHIFAMGAKFKF